MNDPSSAWDVVRRPAVLRRSATIALVVGTVLSGANQGAAILVGPRDGRLLAKIIFNYVVPFIVATLGAASRASRER